MNHFPTTVLVVALGAAIATAVSAQAQPHQHDDHHHPHTEHHDGQSAHDHAGHEGHDQGAHDHTDHAGHDHSAHDHANHERHDHSAHDQTNHEGHDHGNTRTDAAAHETHAPQARPDATGEREVLYWYDPMHPEHRFDEPGPSPFMDMDLVPRYADEVEPGEVNVPTGIQQLMNIRTAPAVIGNLPRRIDTVGVVAYDESRIHHLHPRVSGWIEEVNVHAVGEPIEAGQVLYTLYSPELVNAQEEFLFAHRRGETAALRAARDKLAAFAVQPEVIEALQRDGEVRQALPWIARHDGVVTDLNIRHGMFVEPGDPLIATVDLSSVWVIADVFDRHAAWLDLGQPAEVAVAYNGSAVPSRVAYIYPQVDPVTRTVQVRLPVANADLRLKPGMWSTVRILAEPAGQRLLIPREALIRTGLGARVIVRRDATRFEVREVEAGSEAGDQVEIRRGLTPGEEVVVSGHFLLDSEAALGPARHRLEGMDHHHHH